MPVLGLMEDSVSVADGAECLGDAVVAGQVIRGGHHGFAAEGRYGPPDALVIGGDEDFVESRAALATLPNVPYERLSSDVWVFPGNGWIPSVWTGRPECAY